MERVKRILTIIMTLALVMVFAGISPMTVNAAKKKINVKKVEITKPNSTVLVLKKGKTYQLKTKVTPSNASNKKVIYKSSKKSVVTVNSKGKLTAKKKGTAKITVISKQNKKKKDTIKVIVGTPVTKVKLNRKSKTLDVGETFTLKATLAPSKASYKKVKWTSSNEAVATVSKRGIVTAKAAGTVTITAKADDGSGKKASCKITVKPVVLQTLSIKTTPTTTTYYVGDIVDTAGLIVEASYSDGSKKEIDLVNCTVGVCTADTATTVSPITTALELTHKYIVVSYTEGDVTATVQQPITVEKKKITSIHLSMEAITVAYGTTEAAIKETLSELTITGNEDIALDNSASLWTIDGYDIEKPGKTYTATLDISNLAVPDYCELADITTVTVSIEVEKIVITAIKAPYTSTSGGSLDTLVNEVRYWELTGETALGTINLGSAPDAWNYDEGYMILDASKVTLPEGYVLAEDIEEVRVEMILE